MSDAKSSDKKSINPKIFIIGLPLFILQLAIVYFITANILLSKFEKLPTNDGSDNTEHVDGEENNDDEEDEGEKVELGKHIYTIQDIVVNPKGTNAQRYLLISMGLDVPTEEQFKSLEEKSVIVQDMVIDILSSKTLNELSTVGRKDSFKVEITKNLKESLPDVKVNKIYFQKYVIN